MSVILSKETWVCEEYVDDREPTLPRVYPVWRRGERHKQHVKGVSAKDFPPGTRIDVLVVFPKEQGDIQCGKE